MNIYKVIAWCATFAVVSQANGQLYRYEVELVVTENLVIGSGLGGGLNALTVGTPGYFEFVADAVSTDLNPDPINETSFYIVNEVSFQSAAYALEGADGIYPTGVDTPAQNALVRDDTPPSQGLITDVFAVLPLFNTAEFGESVFLVGQQIQEPNIPTLLPDSSLPTSLDLSLATAALFQIQHPDSDSVFVEYTVQSLRIIEIPAPTAGVLFTLSGFVAMRRRR